MVMKREPLRIIAHRCRGYGARDNSEAAVLVALRSEIDEIEVDVYATKDKQLVLCHDSYFYGLEGLKRRLNQTTLTEAQNCGLLSLNELLALFKKKGVGKMLNIELKNKGYETDLVRLIKKYRLLKSVRIISWISKNLERIHRLDPSLKLSYSFTPKMLNLSKHGYPGWFAFRLPRIIREGKIPLDTVNLVPITRASALIVWRLKRRGLKVVVVNVDTVRGNRRLERLGCWGSMTNEAQMLLEKMREEK